MAGPLARPVRLLARALFGVERRGEVARSGGSPWWCRGGAPGGASRGERVGWRTVHCWPAGRVEKTIALLLL
jgi:hypothetical protein